MTAILVLDGVSTTNAQRRIAWGTVAGSGAQGNQGLAETQLTSRSCSRAAIGWRACVRNGLRPPALTFRDRWRGRSVCCQLGDHHDHRVRG